MTLHCTSSTTGTALPVWRGPSLQQLTLIRVPVAALNDLLAAGQCTGADGRLQLKGDGRLVCTGD